MAARSYFGKPAKDADAGRRRAARRPDQGAELLQSRPLSRPRAGAPRLCAEPHAGGRRRSRADEMKQALAATPQLVAYERPRRDTGFHFVDQIGREAKTLAGIDVADRAVLHGPLDHQAGAAARHRGRAAGGARALRAERPAARSSRAPEANLAERSSSSSAEREAPPRARQAVVAAGAAERAGCRSTTCIGRRPSWSRSATKRRRRESSASASRDGRMLPLDACSAVDPAQPQALRRGLRRRSTEGEGQIGRRPRRAAGAADRAGRGAWCWRTRPAASSPWPAASPIR